MNEAAVIPPEVHPSLGPLARLVGLWRGEGEGAFPTMASFRYREEIEFTHDGRPVLAYRQRTWRVDEDVPLHGESGYLRGPAEGQAELIVAQPTGFGEVAALTIITDAVDTGTLVLDGDRAPVQRTASAKEVRDVRRRFRLDGDALHCDLWMTYGGHEDEHHLRSVLYRA